MTDFDSAATIIAAYQADPFNTTPLFPIIPLEGGGHTIVQDVGYPQAAGIDYVFHPDGRKVQIAADTTALVSAIEAALADSCNKNVAIKTGQNNLAHEYTAVQLKGSLLTIDGVAGSQTVRLYNAAGRMVGSYCFSGHSSINISDLLSGIYIARVSSSAGVTSTRIVLDK